MVRVEDVESVAAPRDAVVVYDHAEHGLARGVAGVSDIKERQAAEGIRVKTETAGRNQSFILPLRNFGRLVGI